MAALLAAYLLSAVTCLTIALVSWRRRRATPAAGSLAVMMLGLTCWSVVDLAGGLAGTATHVDVQLAIYPGVGVVVAGFFCLCRAMADRDWQPTRRRLLLLALEPVLVSIVAATNPLHELLVRPATGAAVPYTFGPLFWVHTAYSYALLCAALVHRPARRPRGVPAGAVRGRAGRPGPGAGAARGRGGRARRAGPARGHECRGAGAARTGRAAGPAGRRYAGAGRPRRSRRDAAVRLGASTTPCWPTRASPLPDRVPARRTSSWEAADQALYRARAAGRDRALGPLLAAVPVPARPAGPDGDRRLDGLIA